MVLNTEELLQEIQHLKEHLEEYKDILDAIKNGEVDALAINRNGKADIFSMQSTDFVYRILVENFGEGALNISEEGFIIYANPAFEKLITGSPSTLIGKDIEDYIDIDSIKEFKSLFKKSFSGTSSGEIYLHINGKKIPVYISLRSLYPNFPSIGIVVTNLTAHKNHEKEISGFKAQLSAKDEALLQAEIMQKSNEKFRLMTDSMPQKVWISDEKGAVEYFNKQWLDYSGHSIDELKKLGWRNLLHPDDLTETEKRWSEALENNEPYEIEHRFLQHDGSYKWHLSRAIPQKDDTGKFQAAT
jgi:two-component system phosphate regulon sensor histidine kinase PhoR